MTRSDLYEIKIQEPDPVLYENAVKNWDSLAKPIDGFGDFEKVHARIAAMQGTLHPSVSRRYAVIMCADNGIVEEGISQSTKEVTRQVAEGLGKGKSSASVLARASGTFVIPVDIGIDTDERIPGLIYSKVRRGSDNFLRGPALTEGNVLEAIQAGIQLVRDLKRKGADIIATGEMGIGNTTTSAVLLCALLGLDPFAFTGRGAGLDDKRLARKREVVGKGVDILKSLRLDGPREKAFACLTYIGGSDIAGLVGLLIGGACERIPVVIDGMISAAAAVIASNICPGTEKFMVASHRGREKTLEKALEYLNLNPLIEGNMALGEGTGAIMLFPLLDQIFYYYEHGARFQQAQIEAYQRFDSD